MSKEVIHKVGPLARFFDAPLERPSVSYTFSLYYY